MKPSGDIGHSLGAIGSSLMLILLLYSARKRLRFLRRAGNIRFWLNYHIWMGVTGPILVIFHTAFKFGGIVAISFWSMIGVALSGVLGRYIYIQIPRTKTGALISVDELERQDKDFQDELTKKFKIPEDMIHAINQISSHKKLMKNDKFTSLFYLFISDIIIIAKLKSLKKQLKLKFKLESAGVREVLKITRRRAYLSRRIDFLKTAHKLLHNWHVIHRPFAIVMLLIMVIHVSVTIIFGYRWIF